MHCLLASGTVSGSFDASRCCFCLRSSRRMALPLEYTCSELQFNLCYGPFSRAVNTGVQNDTHVCLRPVLTGARSTLSVHCPSTRVYKTTPVFTGGQ